MLFRVFVDDSADEQQEKIMVAGAFIGSFAQWCDVNKKWKRRLKADGIKYFRSTEYYSLRDEFSKFRDPIKYPKPKGSEAAKALRDDLDKIIVDSAILGLAVAIPLAMYKSFRETELGASEFYPTDAFSPALQSLMVNCAEASKQELNSTPLAFFCDEGPSAERITHEYLEFKRYNPEWAHLLPSLVHRDDKLMPQLQAADLMANLAKELVTKWLDTQEVSDLKRLDESVYRIDVWTREGMLKRLSIRD